MANFKIIHEVCTDDPVGQWRLCFQWGHYEYDDNPQNNESGYRFIYRQPDNSLQPARGQARIPSADTLFKLIGKAIEARWFIRCE